MATLDTSRDVELGTSSVGAMLGPEGAALTITTLLEEHLDAKAAELGAALEATARLPLVERRALELKLLAPFDVLDLPVDAYPAVLVVAQGMTGLRRVDVDDSTVNAGQTIYAVTYPVRCWAWARAKDEGVTPAERGAGADRARKRLLLAVREVLLDHQVITVTIGRTDDLEPDDPAYRPGITVTAKLDETSLRESYSDVVADDVSTVAAAWLEVEVELEEVAASATPAAELEAVNVTVRHPALDD